MVFLTGLEIRMSDYILANMLRTFCKSKVVGGRVTHTNVNYDGSLGVDTLILEAANITPYEMVLVVDSTNGNRFETYIIPEKHGSGTIAVYGGAALLTKIGDDVIIISTAILDEKEAKNFKKPVVIRLKDGNKL